MKYSYLLFISISLFACNNSSEPETAVVTDTTTAIQSKEATPTPLPEQADLKKRELKNLGLEIGLKEQMQIQDYGDFQMVCTSENVKTAKCFTIEHYKSADKTYLGWGKEDLGEGKVLYFKTSQEVSASGGKDENLEGILIISNEAYLIKASGHDKNGLPDAKWCFPYLKSVSPAGD